MVEGRNLDINQENVSATDLQFVDGELIETPSGKAIKNSGEVATQVSIKTKDRKPITENQTSYLQYIALPLIFLTVALLGGLRLDARDSAFVFLKPALICLIFAVILIVLFFRVSLLRLEGWFSEKYSTVQNIANAWVLLTLFFASTQIFNSLLPERGLPFWVFAFCFFWTLWNNLFSDFDAKKLIQSLGALFGLAFVIKYLILAGLTAPASESWWQGIVRNPTQEAFTWLLDLPRFAPGTGYVQFFALIFYLIGLFLLKPETEARNKV
jgi:hypothetical protein